MSSNIGEYVWFHIGNSGVQVGDQIWKQFEAEKGMGKSFFKITKDNKRIPRSVFIADKTTNSGNFEHSDFSLTETEKIIDKTRRFSEEANNLKGFFLTHSIDGNSKNGRNY